jgi:molybdenum cofactor synthesis domain-containing protein
VITVSDRSARGERDDQSGPAAVDALADAGIPCGSARVVPDGVESVSGAIAAALADGSRLVITTGGTGVTARDLTPEGTRPLLRILLPGISERLRQVNAATIPTAVLSRGVAGIADSAGNRGALVVNLPGSVGGVLDGVALLAPLVRHVIDQLDGGDH